MALKRRGSTSSVIPSPFFVGLVTQFDEGGGQYRERSEDGANPFRVAH
jgi:hypothetical protein